MNKLLTVATLISALGLGSVASVQAEIKVGYVDMAKILSQYYKTMQAQNQINQSLSASQKEIKDRLDAYKDSLAEIKGLSDELGKSELSEETKKKKAKELNEKNAARIKMEQEIRGFKQTREQDLRDQVERMRSGIIKEINVVVQEKVKAGQFDLVLDKSGISTNGVPVVLYSRDTNDFSDEVIAELNKNKPKETPAAAKAPEKKTEKKK